MYLLVSFTPVSPLVGSFFSTSWPVTSYVIWTSHLPSLDIFSRMKGLGQMIALGSNSRSFILGFQFRNEEMAELKKQLLIKVQKQLDPLGAGPGPVVQL